MKPSTPVAVQAMSNGDLQSFVRHPGRYETRPALFGGRRLEGRHIAAVLTYRDHVVCEDGRIRRTEYQERFFRGPDHVWLERDFHPALRERLAARDARGEPKLRFTARLVTRSRGDDATLALVSTAERLIIDVNPDDYDTVGFDGTFDTSGSLVDPALLTQMTPGKCMLQGQWFEQRTKEELLRVQWSVHLRLALAVERRALDGTSRSSTKAELAVCTGFVDMPWNQITNFRHVDFAELGETE